MLEAYRRQEDERRRAGDPAAASERRRNGRGLPALETARRRGCGRARRPPQGPGLPGRRPGGEGQGRLAGARRAGRDRRSGYLPEGRGLHAGDDARRLQRRARSSPSSGTGSSGGAAAEALKKTILVYGAFDEVVKASASRHGRPGGPRVLGGRRMVPVPAGVPGGPDPQGLQGGRRDQHGRFFSGQARLHPPRYPAARPGHGGDAFPRRDRDDPRASGRRATGSPSPATSSARARRGNRPAIP